MTSIAPIPVNTAAATSPGQLTGSGDTSARWFGGLTGAGVGIGAAAGIATVTGRSPVQAVRIAGAVGALGSVAGGAFLGQHLLGKATRSTVAEQERAAQAKQYDVELEIRQLRADAGGQLTSKQKSKVESLRRERIDLVESKPEANFLGKWVIPAALGVGVMIGAGYVAGKLTPDDGKGINAMFNSLMAGGFGAGAGLWAGAEIGHLVTRGDHVDEIPAKSQARIDEIDGELDELLGVSAG